jgi:alkylresorcinol/alkylpyrone synthase
LPAVTRFARLLNLSTAVPHIPMPQDGVEHEARRIFRDQGRNIAHLLPVYENAGIETRYACMPLDWFGRPHGWKERGALFTEHALGLIRDAAKQCLDQAGLDATAVDCIVTVTSSGIAVPSLDARLLNELPFRRDAQRLPVFGLGCAGGVLGLGRAAAMATARPGDLVLLLVVELCSLTFRCADISNSNVVATALFGDGAAAALISCDTPKGALDGAPAIAAWGEYTWPDSLDVMGWRVENDGFGVLFSRDIPSIVRTRFRGAADGFLATQGVTRCDLAGVICHPGGTKVLEALEDALEVPAAALDLSRQVLRDYGNMSAATVLFVLQRAREAGLRGRYLMSSLGPGFTAGFALLDAP